MGKHIILASQSPRRKQLLEMAEVTFDIKVADIDETPPVDMAPEEVPEFLARQKAETIAPEHPNSIVIAADTVVILDNKILGKPRNEQDAMHMLQQLSGNMHKVVSGVCIQEGGESQSFSSMTEVYFNELSQEQIEHYIRTYKPFDKAGGYAIQEWIGVTGISKIDGDYYNVVGLPVNELVRRLNEMS